MLHKMEVLDDLGAVELEVVLNDPTTGYTVQNIDGLDPVKAVIVSSAFSGADGELYQSSRREKRNIVLTFELKREYTQFTTKYLRDRLMNSFMPKTSVHLRFYDDEIASPVDIQGRVESFESPRFTQEPTATISVICFDPDFYEPSTITFDGSTTSLAEDLVINYEGSVETGIIVRLFVDREMTGFEVHHIPADNTLNILYFAAPLVAEDLLKISTVSGDKGATLFHGEDSDSVLYGISPDSTWLTLFPGENRLRVYAEGEPVPYTIEYTNRYGAL